MNVLGINAYHGDASACLLIDGRLVAAAEEERFRRVKHWAGFPSEAVKFCLQHAGFSAAELDHVAINRNPRANLVRKLAYAVAKRPSLGEIRRRAENAVKVRNLRDALAQSLGSDGAKLRARVHHIEHHKAHVASTFLVSGFAEAAIASVDGFGDFVSTMTAAGQDRNVRILTHVGFPHSLGLFYLALTQFLGFPNYGDEYKVMGLGAYGEPEFADALRRLVRPTSRGRFELSLEYFRHHSDGIAMTWEDAAPVLGTVYSDRLVALLGPPREPGAPPTARDHNLAASLQTVYEEILFHVLEELHARTRQRALCLSGGCALNSVANGQILGRTPFDAIYIPPAPGDAGGAVGAAFHVWNVVLGQPRSFVMDRHDWGPGYTDDELRLEVHKREQSLLDLGCRVEEIGDDRDRCRKVASALAEGKIIGWFQGRMEWGARALGNRSILADPRRPEMKDVLNARIKRREAFRPFAPSILKEAVADYFEQDAPSPFMTMTYRVRADKRSVIPAPTHVDGTGRLQTVDRATQPLYWQLIKEFERITTVPLVLNTSFNENEPIVCNPGEALECFLRTRMDVLALGPFVIERPA